jgi:hypothetical protein
MMPTRAADRVRRLEKRIADQDPTLAATRALAKVAAGTATLRDHERAHRAEVRSCRADFVALAPFIVALVTAADVEVADAIASLAFAPDQTLPECVRSALRMVQRAAEAPASFDKSLRRWADQVYPPEHRAAAAIAFLAFGDDEAHRARQNVWTRNPKGEWVLSPQAVKSSKSHGLDLSQIEETLQNSPLVEAAGLDFDFMELKSIALVDQDGTEWIPYAELAGLAAKKASSKERKSVQALPHLVGSPSSGLSRN